MDSEDSEDENASSKSKGKPVPSWAKFPELGMALKKQFETGGVDPDIIFPEVTTCDLEGGWVG